MLNLSFLTLVISAKVCSLESTIKIVLDYAFCSPSLISYIESLNIDEMKCETPSRFLKRWERSSDHCAMTMKMNIPNRQHICMEKSTTMWNFLGNKRLGKVQNLN